MDGTSNEGLHLYSYWRSSAAWRVRIGLALKGLACTIEPVHLLRDGGQQHAPDYVALNPQQLVPLLLHGQRAVYQSLAILEYLEEAWPQAVPLLPATARERARVRGLAQLVACDIHPLNNLRVLQYLEREWDIPADGREAWARHWMEQGLDAFTNIHVGQLCAEAEVELNLQLPRNDVGGAGAGLDIGNLEAGGGEVGVAFIPYRLGELSQCRRRLVDGVVRQMGIGHMPLYAMNGQVAGH